MARKKRSKTLPPPPRKLRPDMKPEAFRLLLLAGAMLTRNATAFEASKYRAEAHSRVASFGNIDTEKRTAEISFSSDVELERWPGFVEKLSHEKDAVDMSRMDAGAPLLFNHDWDTPIGVIESARIENGKGRATVRFGNSARAKEVFEDVRDGILKGVSVGYRISDFREEKRDGKTIVTATRWQPYEASIVSVPADITVGVGRAAAPAPISPTNPQTQHTMPRAELIAALKKRGISVPDNATDAELMALLERSLITPGDDKASGQTAERTRAKEIIEIGKQYKADDLARDFVASGKSVEEFRSELLEKINKRNAAANDANGDIGLSDKEVRQFSVVKLLRFIGALPEDQVRARAEAAFELEACAAAAAKASGRREVKGTMIPLDVLRAPFKTGERGVISVMSGSGYAGTGGNLIATELMTGSFVELLTNRSVILSLAQKLTGLQGKLDIPKQLTGAAGYWIGEDDSAPESDITFGSFGLDAKTVATKVEITRKMLMQPSLDVEAWTRRELAKRLGLTIDLAGFYGDGTANAPVGIKHTAGINGVNFAAVIPTYAELVAMETALENDNIDAASARYIINNAMRGAFKTAKKFPTATDSATIWEAGNTVNGTATERTNQIAAGDVFYGDFSELLVGMWGGLELTADPYSGSDKGRLRIVAMQDVDYAVSRPGSFCYGVKPA